MATTDDGALIVAHLRELYRRTPATGAFLELKSSREKTDEVPGEFGWSFFRLEKTEIDRAIRWIRNEGARRCNVYLCACLRKTDDHPGTRQDIWAVSFLWCDQDWKDYPGGEQEAREVLAGFTPQPTLTVRTGGGAQSYWVLRDPVLDPNVLEVESLLRGIARALRADPNVIPLQSCLRVPFTFNYKPIYDPPPMAIIERQDGRVHDLADFDHVERVEKLELPAVDFDPDIVATELPLRFAEELKQNRRWQRHWDRDPSIRFPGGRNTASEHIAALLIFAGEADFTDEEGAAVYDCFYHRPGVSESVLSPKKKEATLRALRLGRDKRAKAEADIQANPETEADIDVDPFEQLVAVVDSWLHVVDRDLLAVMIAVVVANMIEADPLWILIVAPPSSLKTELIRALGRLEQTHLLSNLTAQTFLSGKIDKSGRDYSLLPRISGKVLLMKDFTTILMMHRDARAELFAQLREIFDGEYSKAYGTGVEKVWQGKLGLMAGVTEIIYGQTAVHTVLGERFIYYRPRTDDRFKMGLRASQNTGSEHVMRKALADAMAAFFATMKIEMIAMEKDDPVRHQIVRLADVIAHGRCGVNRDGYDRGVRFVPEPEVPARLAKQLLLLGHALAIIRRRKEVGEIEMRVIRKVARDSMIDSRLRIFKELFKGPVWLETGEISRAVNLPGATVLELLEDAWVLKTIARDRDLGDERTGRRGESPYKWILEAGFRNMIQDSGVFIEDLDPELDPDPVAMDDDVPF